MANKIQILASKLNSPKIGLRYVILRATGHKFIFFQYTGSNIYKKGYKVYQHFLYHNKSFNLFVSLGVAKRFS